MIVGDVDLPRSRLANGAHAKEHSVALPTLFVDVQHRHVRCGARQSALDSPDGFVTAEPMRNGDDEWCRHRKILFVPNACKRCAHEWKRQEIYGVAKAELYEFPQVSPADQATNAPRG